MSTPRRGYLESLVAGLDPRHDLLVAGLGANARYLPHLGATGPCLALCDAMGTAIPLALGMALACPGREVVALEGDGSLLMALGTLATVGAARPPNLTILLFENGHYESSGGQDLPAVRVDFVQVARAARLAVAERVDGVDRFADAFQRARASAGPRFLVLDTVFDPAEPIPPYSDRPDEIRVDFARRLAATRGESRT